MWRYKRQNSIFDADGAKMGKSMYEVRWTEHRMMSVIADDQQEALRRAMKRKSEVQEPFLTETMSAFTIRKGEDI